MGHFTISAEKCDNYGEIIDQTTDAGLEKNHFYHFYLSQPFSFGQLWNSPVTCRYFKNVFYKSPDNNDPRANSRSMSKFVTIYSKTGTDKFAALLQNSQLTCNFDTNCCSV